MGRLRAISKSWLVLETGWREEFLASRSVKRAGFDVYLPLYRERRNVAGVRAVRPLFLTYMFARMTNSWRDINSLRGVKRVIMGAGELPSVVQFEVIEGIRALEDPETGYVLVEGELPASSRRFVLHQQIKSLRGMFAGQSGLFLGRTDAARVRVLFQLLGQPVEQEMLLRDIA